MNVSEKRIFIIDDDHSVCKGLSRLLHSAGYKTEIFYSAIDYLQREPFHGIGCLILDVRMPHISGIDLQKQLIKKNNELPIIFLTAHGELPMGIEAMKRGAVDFLLKPVDEGSLFAALQRALEKYESVLKERLQTANIKARLASLTGRELEVLQYILGGAKNKQIADNLSISEKTVKAHRGKIMLKMNVSTAAELGWIGSIAKIAVKNNS